VLISTRLGLFKESEEPAYEQAARDSRWAFVNREFVMLNESSPRKPESTSPNVGFRYARSAE
jgi:hypothetical protein